MKMAILKACQKSMETSHILITPRRIESTRNSNGTLVGIQVNQSVKEALQPGGDIYCEVQREFKLHLKCKKPRGRQPTLHHPIVDRFASIEW
jgi:hypothetical protein